MVMVGKSALRRCSEQHGASGKAFGRARAVGVRTPIQPMRETWEITDTVSGRARQMRQPSHKF